MKLKISNGNHKIGKDTLIINMASATDCPSRKLQLCKLPATATCYAYKAEVFRTCPTRNALASRRAGALAWHSNGAPEIVRQFVSKLERRRATSEPIKYIRFNESGDFSSAVDIVKIKMLALAMQKYGITVYGYTCRNDLFTNRIMQAIEPIKNLVIIGTTFMLHNQVTFTERGKGICPGDCRRCVLCKKRRYREIPFGLH